MLIKIIGRAYEMSFATDKGDMTVGEVKLHLQNTYLIPADHQNLIFSGVYLDNARLLSAYGIGHNSTIEIEVNMNEPTTRYWNHGNHGSKLSLALSNRPDSVGSKQKDASQTDREVVSPLEAPMWRPMMARKPDFITTADIASAKIDGVKNASTEIFDLDSMILEGTKVDFANYGETSYWDLQHLPNTELIGAVVSTAESATVPSTNDFLKLEPSLDYLTEEVQKACDLVSEVTGAKKELSMEIDRLEKKLSKLYMNMKGVTEELQKAVEKMAIETQRLRGAVVTPHEED